MLVLLFN